MLFYILCSRTAHRHRLTQSSKDKHLDCNSSTLQIHVTLQPSPDYLSPFYGSSFQKGEPGEDLTQSQIYVQGTENIQEESTEPVCLRALPSLKYLNTASM